MNGKRKAPVGRPFQKGQSGNPGGRPKALVDLRELARAYTKPAVLTLAAILSSRKASDTSKVMAATALLDRGWGRPVQAMEHSMPEGGAIPFTVKIGLLIAAQAPALPEATNGHGGNGHGKH